MMARSPAATLACTVSLLAASALCRAEPPPLPAPPRRITLAAAWEAEAVLLAVQNRSLWRGQGPGAGADEDFLLGHYPVTAISRSAVS